jgi:two-component system sensor histidine kinase KdpD
MKNPAEYVRAALILLLALAGCLLLRGRLNPTDIAMLLLLADVFVAYRCSLGPAILVSILSIIAFDFAFIPPYYQLAVHDTSYLLTFVVMLAVALLMGRMTALVRQQARSALEREQRTRALYRLNQELGSAQGADQVLATAGRHLEQVAGTVPAWIRSTGDGTPSSWPADGPFRSVEVRVAVGWALETGEMAGRGTPHSAEAEALVIPLKSPTRALGVVVQPLGDRAGFTTSQRETLRALVDETARALERTVLAEQHELARMEIEAERLRTALLSSLSHDLRSPLGSIEGAASLLNSDNPPGADTRKELAAAILHESRRMNRLVANLLDMIRVETGSLAVKKEWQPLEEALGVALIRLDERLKSHPVLVELPEDLPLVPVDGLLLEQVFINLLENAAKYTPAGTGIAISAWPEAEAVVVEVADRGPGIPASELEAVFHKFYRLSREERGNGAGLGLTICRGIVTAHGGKIWVEQGRSGGAAFRFTLPLQGPAMRDLPAEAAEPV